MNYKTITKYINIFNKITTTYLKVIILLLNGIFTKYNSYP